MASLPTLNKPHILVLSFPEQGHLNPLLQISRKLASHGCTISFVLSEHTYNRFVISENGSPQSSDLRFVAVSDGLPEDCSRGSFLNALEASKNMSSAVELLMEKQLILHQQQDAPTPITFMLADVFTPWSQQLACKLGIPRLVVFTSNAAACSIAYHTSSLLSQGILPFKDENNEFIVKEPVTCIPGIPPLHPADFPVFVTLPASHHLFQFGLQVSENLRTASGIIINTFEELESSAIAELRKQLPVYAVGPLPLLCEKIPLANIAVSYWQEEEECLRWLDTRENSTVLYVSFGSVSTVSLSHIKELAFGLEASAQAFLWVIRPDAVDGTLSDMLPEGFASRTKDRGLLISWAPQAAVLGHRAVGGFLSHCGWNSVMENVSAGGVPMVCRPLGGEQRLNCRLVVDEWKVGVEVEGREVGRKEVERAVRAVMERGGKEEGEGISRRRRGAEMSNRAHKAMLAGGSSLHSFQALLKVLSTPIS